MSGTLAQTQTGEDQQIKQLQQKLLQLCPGQQSQIMIMDKQDLIDLLAVVNANNQTNNVNDQAINGSYGQGGNQKSMSEIQERRIIQQKLLPYCAEMKNQLSTLPLEDLKQIYYLHVAKQTPSNSTSPQVTTAPGQNKTLQKNGELNVSEMKKILMQKQPVYRNQIKNMKDQQIKQMFKQLKREIQIEETTHKKTPTIPVQPYSYSGNINKNNFDTTSIYSQSSRYPAGYQAGPPSNFNHYPPESNRNIDLRRNRKFRQSGSNPFNYGTSPVASYSGNVIPTRRAKYRQQTGHQYFDYPDQYEGQNDTNSKMKSELMGEKAKEKQKHKCKITFYLNQSDFQDNQQDSEKQERTETTKKNMLAKIMEAFSIALNSSHNNLWRNQGLQKSEQKKLTFTQEQNQNLQLTPQQQQQRKQNDQQLPKLIQTDQQDQNSSKLQNIVHQNHGENELFQNVVQQSKQTEKQPIDKAQIVSTLPL